MLCTCNHGTDMTKMIQIRHVPTSIHRALKAKAALAGKSLSDWILEELTALAAMPTEEELLERLRKAEPFGMKGSSAKMIRKDRDAA